MPSDNDLADEMQAAFPLLIAIIILCIRKLLDLLSFLPVSEIHDTPAHSFNTYYNKAHTSRFNIRIFEMFSLGSYSNSAAA